MVGRSGTGGRGRGEGAVPRGVVVGVVVLMLLVGIGVGAKVLAGRAAEDQVDRRVTAVERMLAGATPEDFLAFNAGRKAEGSVAQAVADQDDFVSVDARAERAVIRFQPGGWWQGFTERCVVAVVTADAVVVEAPKVACVRVDPASY